MSEPTFERHPAPTAGVPAAPVVVSFATIMDGLVLRWFRDEAGFANGEEVASASRERAWFRDEATDERLFVAVWEVHRRLRDEVYGGPWGLAHQDSYQAVRAMATHRTTHLFGDDLVPLEGES